MIAQDGLGLQGYLAHKNQPPPKDPTVGLFSGPDGGSRGSAVCYERGTPCRFKNVFGSGVRTLECSIVGGGRTSVKQRERKREGGGVGGGEKEGE